MSDTPLTDGVVDDTPLTNAVVENVPMVGTMEEYRIAQAAALEVWAGKLERDRAGLERALRRLLAICDDEFDPNRCPEMAEARAALRAAKGEA